VSTRRNKAYTLVAALLLLIGAFLFLNDAVASWWAAGVPASREAYVRRFYWDVSCLGFICALTVGWCLRIWLKRRKIN
jgi:hypothetical protein